MTAALPETGRRWLAAVAGTESPPSSAGGAPAEPSRKSAEMPDNLKRVVEDYERKMHEGDEGKSPMQRFFQRKAGAVGVIFAVGVVYLMSAVDDVASEVHNLTAHILRWLGPEAARRWILRAAALNILPKDYDKDDPYLIVEPQDGLRFITPIGLAPGFDVKAVGPNAFLNMGFGFVEMGPVAAGDGEAVLALRQQLRARDRTDQVVHLGIVGVCVRGRSREELVAVTQALAPYVTYLSVDVEALPEELRRDSALVDIVRNVVLTANSVPGGGPAVFLRVPAAYPAKSAGAAERREAVASAALAGVAGGASAVALAHFEDEDLVESGAAWELLGEIYRRVDGRLPLIASGRFGSGAQALQTVQQGATVLQISYQLTEEGLPACRRLKSDLSGALMAAGVVKLQDAVGSAHRKKKGKKRNPWKGQG